MDGKSITGLLSLLGLTSLYFINEKMESDFSKRSDIYRSGIVVSEKYHPPKKELESTYVVTIKGDNGLIYHASIMNSTRGPKESTNDDLSIDSRVKFRVGWDDDSDHSAFYQDFSFTDNSNHGYGKIYAGWIYSE